jgi:phosphoglycerate dehydrogenase-like enzyme
MKVVIDVDLDPAGWNRVERLGAFNFERISPPSEEAQIIEPSRIANADILFCNVPPINLSDMQELKWMQLASTGYSHLFGLGLSARGIRTTNCRGCLDVPIGEWVVAMMINLARDCRQMFRNQEAANWDRGAIFQREIRGLTVGCWGYGGIGRETARLARQLGLRVHVLTRSGVRPRRNIYVVPNTGDPEGLLPHREFRAGQELEFLQGLDFLVISMPLTKITEGLIGERELQALPRTAFVLNPARGPIIRESALLRALREKWIAGAALDTHYYYPMPQDHPLWHFPNVILTPHISGSSLGPNFLPRLWDLFSLNLARFARGEPLLNELTPAELAGS